jgi:hypothetical protein
MTLCNVKSVYFFLLSSSPSSPIMSTSVNYLNIFDLQMELDNSKDVPIQESIDYCELRFRTILSAFGRSEDAAKQLIQRGLHQELV